MNKRPLFTQTRLQLLASFLGVLTAVLIVFSIGTGLFFKLSLSDRYDRQLVAFAHAALGSIDIEGGHFDFRSRPLPSGPSPPSDTAVQWFDPTGRLLRATGRLPGLQERLAIKPGRGAFQDSSSLRSWVEPVYAPGGIVGFLRVSRSLDAIEAPFQQLLWGLTTAIPAALALSALGGWWLTGLAIRPVEETFRRLEQFTADAGHELRNPLMAIQSNCAVALKYPQEMRSGDRQKFLLIEDASRQLIDLVQELLKLARADERPVEPCVVDMAALTETLVEEYRLQTQALGLALSLDCPPVPYSCLVIGKSVQLRCVLVNLIDNALKFTPGGGQIRVALAPSGATVTLRVSDSGPGIAPEDLPHVFDRFWQADRARSRRQGTGLGLAIARSIVEAHSGTLAVTSTPAVGSTFEVRLPTAGASRLRSQLKISPMPKKMPT